MGGCARKSSKHSDEKFGDWLGTKFARGTSGNIATWTTTAKSPRTSGTTASASTSTVSSQLGPRRHSTMDKALAHHADNQDLNLDKKNEDFFSLEKIQIRAPILWDTTPCALSFS